MSPTEQFLGHLLDLWDREQERRALTEASIPLADLARIIERGESHAALAARLAKQRGYTPLTIWTWAKSDARAFIRSLINPGRPSVDHHR